MDERYIEFLLAKIVDLTHERDGLLLWGSMALYAVSDHDNPGVRDGFSKITARIKEAHDR